MSKTEPRADAAHADEVNELAAQAAESILGPNPFVGLNRREILASWSRLTEQAVKQPTTLAKHHLTFLQETARACFGLSDRTPAKGDRRFKDETWTRNPLYRAYMQTYLGWVDALNAWVDDLGMDRKNTARSRFVVSLMTDAFAATNSLLGNPAALRKLVETNGQSAVDGMRNLISDMQENDGMPSQVDKSQFVVGENLATSPGAVVFRNEVLELVQYAPSTPRVAEVPMLIVPPQINKFYVFDLSPEKSLVKFMVDSGHTVYAISWRNPGPEHRDWTLDDYVAAIHAASDAILDISKAQKVNLIGACAGGVTTTIAAARLAAQADDRLNSLTLLVAVLDMAAAEDTAMGLFVTDETVALAKAKSGAAGVLEGSEMARVFAWLRPNDLVWNYWVNNYLLGNEPPAFDILYWNNDTTRLPAGLHGQFLDMYKSNPLASGADYEVAGGPVAPDNVKADVFLVGGTTDHITPWKATYRSCRLFGGDVEYVLSNSGHVQSILNPPGNPKACYYTCDGTPDDPEAYLEQATLQQGSWWDHWMTWLDARSGKRKAAPKSLGNARHPAGEAAPGTYVHVK